MEKKQAKQSSPLYYIEQPSFTGIAGNSQSVSIRKGISGKKKKELDEKKEKKAKQKEKNRNSQNKRGSRSEKRNSSLKNKEKNKHPEGGKEKGIEENVRQEKVGPDQEIKEIIDYLATRPHFLEPIVACETKDEHIQGRILEVGDEEITILDGVSLSEVVVKEADIDNLYIVSL